MKIACLYIATGRYTVFWKDFYLSTEKYFLPSMDKDYFVFTDNDHIDFESNPNVFSIYQKKLGWPYDTMMRFDIFLTQEEKLQKYDYIFFFNANLEIKSLINEDVLPSQANDGIVVCQHPGFYNKSPEQFTYDRNPKSTAYIPMQEGKYYVAGGLNGGLAKSYLELCHQCSEMIHHDLDNNIIPLWHDESIINKYIIGKNPLVLDCRYLYPEGKSIPEFKRDIKILIRDKSNPKYGGHEYLRGISDTKKRTFKIFGIKFTLK